MCVVGQNRPGFGVESGERIRGGLQQIFFLTGKSLFPQRKLVSHSQLTVNYFYQFAFLLGTERIPTTLAKESDQPLRTKALMIM